MFRLWRPSFTEDLTTIPSAFLDQLRLQLSRMVDARFGGVSSPTYPIDIKGKGLSVNPLYARNISGIITRRGTARFPLRIERITITVADVSARASGTLSDIIVADAAGQTANRTLTVDVTPSNSEGEIIFITVEPSVAFSTRVDSLGGGANPLMLFGAGAFPGTDPEWCALWFDPLRTGSNPDGEWALLAHGAT